MPVAIKWGQDIETQQVEWLWKPFIPYGKVTIIQGDGGEGKTSLILTIAAMLTQGIQPPTMKYGHLYPIEKIEPQNISTHPQKKKLPILLYRHFSSMAE